VNTDGIRYTIEKAALADVDWAAAKADLGADAFDNGRTPDELRICFERAYSAALAFDGDRVVSMARLLADGVCNAFLVDVWTHSAYRRRGIGAGVVRRLCATVPGHHIALFTEHHEAFYAELGFSLEIVGMSLIVGQWLNRSSPVASRDES
jgi:predicted GNAT family acetyltransferase